MTNHFTFISADDLLMILEQKMQMPKGAVWISFDDGWHRNMDNVVPIIVEYNVPATFFISTSEVDHGRFWFSEVIKHKECLPRDLQTNIRHLWQLEESKRRAIVADLRTTVDCRGAGKGSVREAMTKDEVASIAALPQVTIGSHTASHPILPHCTDLQIEEELRTSKQTLEKWTGKQVIHFSYPNGEYSDSAKRSLLKLGYATAATTEARFGLQTDHPYEIPRFHVMDDGSFAENLCHMLGIWSSLTARTRGTPKPSHVHNAEKPTPS